MDLSKNFQHNEAEQKWYQHWLERKYFASKPDNREPYTIVIPPPNVTGVLHMGHCLNNTIQDILVRRARMKGKNACWVPGTDHASIATEAKVVQMLREKGVNKSNLNREEFLKYAWEWKEKYGGIILQQLKKLGCSLDWARTTFTMDPHYYDSVINVFVDLYNKGYIYRGKRMINWDVKAKTALSDEEVIRKEVNSKLYFVKYKIEGSDDSITIATVRPETILGDTAIAVHPNDERYKHLQGKFAFVPLINRRIPIITDEYVEMDFGTGALKITPAHDKNDYQVGEKHSLEVIDVLNDDGTMSEAAQLYIGEDRFEARKKIVKELEAKGHVVKVENYVNQIGFSERTDVVVEDRLSMQWWVDMKKLSKPALEAVMNDEIKFYPAKFKNLYRNWMENIRDWCISRQLWWGHRIPAWYCVGDDICKIECKEPIVSISKPEKCPHCGSKNLQQDEDVMDTWFSSWLWPFEVFKGYSNPGNADIKYYYPTNTLVTAPEIIFFWVARMIMAGFEYMDEKPFNEVYFTGIVRDELGRKMSKQLGNSPDLLGMIDKYGADAVRFGIMISSPAGNDLLFDVKEESTLKQGSFFINKIWNALRLVRSWESRVGSQEPGENFAVNWFENRLNEVKAEIENQYKDFRLSESLKTIYSLIWDDFCSWYLEWIKPAQDQTIGPSVYAKTVEFFEELMQLLHPFMPFITEEVYHLMKVREAGDDIVIRIENIASEIDQGILSQGNLLKEFITKIRNVRVRNNLKFAIPISLTIVNKEYFDFYGNSLTPNFPNPSWIAILTKQLNASRIEFNSIPKATGMVVNETVQIFQCQIEVPKDVDTVENRKRLEDEIGRLQSLLASVDKKLNNQKFIENAKPEVIAIEKKKKSDTLEKIKTLEESLSTISLEDYLKSESDPLD
jgi:valyl-tRNA synthetase